MEDELRILIDRLLDKRVLRTSIIPWASPIPFFGDLKTAGIGTVGLNPSNREFVDINGEELDGSARRFHTFKSLKIASWNETSLIHQRMINYLCSNYFNGNPYNEWFKKLDFVISGTNKSYYFPIGGACHLDLIPYATSSKWASLSVTERKLLLELSKDTLAILIRASPINTLILNGITVVENLKKISNVEFEKKKMPGWTLPRASGYDVTGYSFKGKLSSIGGISLKREITVLGYNHNIQSSYGVTLKSLKAIRNWISTNCK